MDGLSYAQLTEMLDSHQPKGLIATNFSNFNSACGGKSGAPNNCVDPGSLKRTITQLKMSMAEINQAMCCQNQASSGEGRILREIMGIKRQLCEISKKISGNCEDSVDTSALTKIRDVIKCMLSKVGCMSADETKQTLNSILCEIEKLLSSSCGGGGGEQQKEAEECGASNSNFNNGEEGEDDEEDEECSHCCAVLAETPCMAEIMECLKQIVLNLMPSVEFQACGLENIIVDLMEKLEDTVQSNSCQTTIIEEILNAISRLELEVKKQCSCESEYMAKIHSTQRTIEGIVACRNASNDFGSEESNVIYISKNTSNQCCTELKPTELLVCLTKHLKKVLKKMRPELEIPECDLMSTLSFMICMIKDAVQSSCVDSDVTEKLPKMLRCLLCDFSKQGCSSSFVAGQVRDLLNLLGNLNQSHCFQETPQLQQLVSQIQEILKCVRPELQFSGCDIKATLECIIGCLPSIIQTCCSNARFIERLTKLIECLKNELGKQEKAAECFLKKLEPVCDLLKCCGGGINTFDPCTAPIEQTKLITCLMKHFKKIVCQIKPGADIPDCDLELAISMIMNTLKEALKCGNVDCEIRENLPKMLRCLICDLSRQGKANCPIVAKVQEVQDLLSCGGVGNHTGCECPGTDPCAPKLHETPQLKHLVSQVLEVLKCFKPDYQPPSCCDVRSNLMNALEPLKCVLQAGCIGQKALEMIDKLLQCLDEELCKQAAAAGDLRCLIKEIAKIVLEKREAMAPPLCPSALLCQVASQLQEMLKCIKPDAHISACDFTSALKCLMDIIKQIAQSGCADPKVLERIGNLLRCMEGELNKQPQAAVGVLARLHEVQKMISKEDKCSSPCQQKCPSQSSPCGGGGGGGICGGGGSANAGCGGSLQETPELRCCVNNLMKVVKCFRPDLQFKSCDLESNLMCLIKLLCDAPANQLNSMKCDIQSALQCIEQALCQQNLSQSNLMKALQALKRKLSACPSSNAGGGSCADAGGGGVCGCGQKQCENLEEVVSRNVCQINKCIRDLEVALGAMSTNDCNATPADEGDFLADWRAESKLANHFEWDNQMFF